MLHLKRGREEEEDKEIEAPVNVPTSSLGRVIEDVRLDRTVVCSCCSHTQEFELVTPGILMTTVQDTSVYVQLSTTLERRKFIAGRLQREGLLDFLKTRGQSGGLTLITGTVCFALFLHLRAEESGAPDGHLLLIIRDDYPYSAPTVLLDEWLPCEDNKSMLFDLAKTKRDWSPAFDCMTLLSHFGDSIAHGPSLLSSFLI